LGAYPEVSLKEARTKREEYRKIVKRGEDPSELRKKQKVETKENVVNTFENIAREYLEKKEAVLAKTYYGRSVNRLESNVFPFLGGLPIKKIKPQELLGVIRKIEERGAIEIAHKTLQTVGHKRSGMQ
jgi:integrase